MARTGPALLLGLALATPVLRAQDGEAERRPAAGERRLVVVAEQLPTDREVVEALSRWSAMALVVVDPRAPAQVAEALNRSPTAPVITLGERAFAAVAPLRALGRVVRGGFVGASAPDVLPKPLASLPLAVSEAALFAARAALFREGARTGFVRPAEGQGPTLAPGDLDLPVRAGDDLEARLWAALPHLDLVVVLDGPAVTSYGEAALAAAARARRPVLTTSPWLARSGAVFSATPDFEAYARRLLLAATGRSPAAVPELPCLRGIDVARALALGLDLDARRLAAADRITDVRVGPP